MKQIEAYRRPPLSPGTKAPHLVSLVHYRPHWELRSNTVFASSKIRLREFMRSQIGFIS